MWNFEFFFFNDTATTEIYTLSLHDALPIWCGHGPRRTPRCRSNSRSLSAKQNDPSGPEAHADTVHPRHRRDRKSTRLNSSHANISYAVFCLKKKLFWLVVRRLPPTLTQQQQ